MDDEELRNELEHHKHMVRELNRRRRTLERQSAQKGSDTPPQVWMELEDVGNKIKTHQSEIARLEPLVFKGKAQIASGAQQQSQNTKQLEALTKLLGVKSFDNTTDFLNYVTRRMKQAKKSVKDTTWGPTSQISFLLKIRHIKTFSTLLLIFVKRGYVLKK